MAAIDVPLEDLEYVDVNGESATTLIYTDSSKNPIVKWTSEELTTSYTVYGLLWYPLLGSIKLDTVGDGYKIFTWGVDSSYDDEIGGSYVTDGSYTHFQLAGQYREINSVYIGSRYSSVLGANYNVVKSGGYFESYKYSPFEGANNYIRWYESAYCLVDTTNRIWCKYSENVSTGDMTITTPSGDSIPNGGNIGSGNLTEQLELFDWGSGIKFKQLFYSDKESFANNIGTKEGYIIVSFTKSSITEY